MDVFRQLPAGVQRQARRVVRGARCLCGAYAVRCHRCGSWTTTFSSVTSPRLCLRMPRRLRRCCVSWTWHVHARAAALGGCVLTRGAQSCVLAAVPGQAGAAGAAPACTGKLGGVAARPLPSLSRKSLRGASASIQRLVRLVRAWLRPALRTAHAHTARCVDRLAARGACILASSPSADSTTPAAAPSRPARCAASCSWPCTTPQVLAMLPRPRRPKRCASPTSATSWRGVSTRA